MKTALRYALFISFTALPMGCTADDKTSNGLLLSQHCAPCKLDSGGRSFLLSHHLASQQLTVCQTAKTECQTLSLPSYDEALVSSTLTGWHDINHDGLADLYLITAQGAANSYAEYWLFDPATEQFVAQGEWPILSTCPTSEPATLCSYENNGFGGRLYRKAWYAVSEGQITVIATEEQQLDPEDAESVIKRSYTLQNNQLSLLKEARIPLQE